MLPNHTTRAFEYLPSDPYTFEEEGSFRVSVCVCRLQPRVTFLKRTCMKLPSNIIIAILFIMFDVGQLPASRGLPERALQTH